MVMYTFRDPRFTGSYPTEVMFFQDLQVLSISPREGIYGMVPESEISGVLKHLKPEKIGLCIFRFSNTFTPGV